MSAVDDRFAHLSAAARALLNARAQRGRAGVETDGNTASQRVDRAPLSFAQRRVWLFEQITPGTATYNRPKRIHLDGPLDVPSLRAAVREIFRRHDVLRSAIGATDGIPYQHVLPLDADYVHRIDLADHEDAESRWMSIAESDAVRPFDIASGPLARCTLVRIAAERHVLLFNASHLAFDGWSTGILCTELGALYRAFVAGRESPLAELERQYCEFALDETADHPGTRTERDVAYWTAALSGASPVVRLPRESVDMEPPESSHIPPSILLRRDLIGALKRLSRSADATLFMTLFAAFGVLLARLSGLDDVVIGVPVAGRLRPGSSDLIGFFSNTLPIRVQLTGGVTFRALLAQVRDSVLGALEHQELPFDVLVEHIRPERTLEHAPVVQTLFNYRNFAALPLHMGDVQARIENAATGASVLELSFDLEERPDGILCVAEADRSLFLASTVTRWLSHYACLLDAVIADPDRDVMRLPLLTPAEREHMLVAWNSRSAPEHEATLHRLVEQQVRRTPHAIALASESGEMTYAELNRRANALARDLAMRGVGPDVLVCVCLERSPDLVIALLAVLKAGGAYVPLDPDYPSERIAFMLADAGAHILVTAPELVDRLPSHGGETLHLNAEYWSRLGMMGDDDDPEVTCTPQNLAYVMYTSGSTGRPKGAMNTHRGVCNFLLRSCELRKCGPHDRILSNTPASFDTSVPEIFGALICGARVVIARPGGHADPAYLCGLIARQRVTVVYVVPSMLQALLEVPDVIRQFATVRLVGAGGEVLSVALQERFYSLLPATLRNTYGPTETAVAVTDWECERESRRRTVPLGRPFPNVRIHVLDAYGEPVPIGVASELYIGGAAVGRGYLGRPELTDERFVADPFSASGAERLYRTGDVARYTDDGMLEYLGRRDHQIKLRGVRIELGEIEAALVAHGGVKQAVVVAHDYGQGDIRLVAYLVAHEHDRLSDQTLRAHLQRALPSAMLPSSYVFLDALPLTPSGKVARDALPIPAVTSTGEYVAPRSSTEHALARMWEELFELERVGVRDNFFALGGHSLTAMRMVSRAHALGLPVEVASVFGAPTIEELAALVDESPGANVTSPIRRLSRDGYRPSSV